MISNTLIVLVLLIVALLFGRLAWGAWHARRGWVKWVGGILSSLLTLLLVLLLGVILLGFYRISVAPYQYIDTGVEVSMTPEQIALGERFAYACADCHSSTGLPPLDGNPMNFLEGGPPLGELYAPNLTPGGDLKDWTDAEIIRAIREGVDNEGRPLYIMPSQGFHAASDADVAAMVAYIRSQPAVENALPERRLTALAALMVGAGMVPSSAQEPITGPVLAPEAGTVAYGEYISRSTGCRDCHGQNFEGMAPGQGPFGPNLTLIVPTWSEETFRNIFRQGIGPGGSPISDEMPWKAYGKMFTDEQLKDLYDYLHGLEPVTALQP